MGFIVDASICASWLLPDEVDPISDAARARLLEDEAFTPAIWWYEIRNVILVAGRRGRLAQDRVVSAFKAIEALPLNCVSPADPAGIMSLATQHRLTFYDAAYLSLALRLGFPLASLDDDLRAAARREGVPLVAA